MNKNNILFLGILIFLLSSCEEKEDNIYEDGNYYAETLEYSYGWKAFLEVEISDDAFSKVNFDYVDMKGNLKSETNSDTYSMEPHPVVWLPQYEELLIASSISPEFEGVDAISGATGSGNNLQLLAEAVLEAAKIGDTSKQIVDVTEK